VDNIKEDFQGRGTFGSRGKGRSFSGIWNPLKLFICNEPHKDTKFPQNTKRVMVAQEGEELLTE